MHVACVVSRLREQSCAATEASASIMPTAVRSAELSFKKDCDFVLAFVFSVGELRWFFEISSYLP